MQKFKNIILFNYQNNYIEILSIISNVVKHFNILSINLSVLNTYFDNPTK